ncbi:serine carboxypeptidase [Trifolium repens]|nr:serine carboxypeptidase [Trifolium repens]
MRPQKFRSGIKVYVEIQKRIPYLKIKPTKKGRLVKNRYSWNRAANMLYLESPVDQRLTNFSGQVGSFVNAFNIIEDICLPSEFQSVNETPMDDGDKRDVCVEGEIPSYMNRGEVREAIHAKLVGITKWTICSTVLFYNWKKLENPMISLLGILLNSGVRVMVYSGDQDSLIPLIGTRSLLQGLAKEIGLTSEDYRPWFDGLQVAGWTQTYGDNLTFATTRGAGHATPTSQPRRVLCSPACQAYPSIQNQHQSKGDCGEYNVFLRLIVK